jgi:hypothetical protein
MSKAKKVSKVSVSKSGMAVAKFLLKHYPKEAQQIATGMEKAATAKTMKRRLARIAASVSASASAEA